MGEKTQKNLAEAFAGESQANRKYLAFAQKAEEEALPAVAKLFRVAAASETVHALYHFNQMEGVADTKTNLKAALEGETYEFEKMYPQMVEDAMAEGESGSQIGFSWANKVEKEHADLYKKAYSSPESFENNIYFVCNKCGHVHLDEAPERCPICGAPKSIFKEVE
jgi:rubrerythrin